MKRSDLLERMLNWKCECDILVIGGGATGLGAAVDAEGTELFYWNSMILLRVLLAAVRSWYMEEFGIWRREMSLW